MRVVLLPIGVLVVEIATKEIADPQATRPHQGIRWRVCTLPFVVE